MEDLKAKSSRSITKADRPMKWVVSIGKIKNKGFERMFGTEVHITCGDLTLFFSKGRYNESDAASEVS